MNALGTFFSATFCFLVLGFVQPEQQVGAQVPQPVEELLLAQKWREACQLLVAQSVPESDPVPQFLNAMSLAVNDHLGASKGFLRLRQSDLVPRLLEYCSSLVRRYPNNAVALMLDGDALARSTNFDTAIAVLDKAVALDGTSALMYDVKGVRP